MVGVTGCSSEEEKQPTGISAGEICDGTLDQTAKESLQRIGGTEKFTELTGTTDSGEPNEFSLDRAAANLHEQESSRSRCTVYKAGDETGKPLIQLDFKASESYPKRSDYQQEDLRDRTFYSLGLYADTKEGYSTSLYFHCETKGAEGTTPYINAGIFSVADQLEGDSTSKDRMTILNSVSRRLAAELGCSDEAGLASKVPAPEAG
ncbi:hypothetical protein [Streptomyces sp. NPDC055036]